MVEAATDISTSGRRACVLGTDRLIKCWNVSWERHSLDMLDEPDFVAVDVPEDRVVTMCAVRAGRQHLCTHAGVEEVER